MRMVLAMTIFVPGVFVTTPAPFALSGPFLPLSSEQMDEDRDPDQSGNERDVADSENEGSTTSATQANDQLQP